MLSFGGAMLRIVVVDAGNYEGRGLDYVQILHDAVWRNLPEGFPGSFTVFTDRDIDYGEGIEECPLPGNLKGWFNKLYLFKSGLFPQDDRILFLDLDTVILGKLDAIASYEGRFAILSDYYHPTRLQSSIMAWRAGDLSFIWDDYEAAGFPEVEGGDQAWIGAYFSRHGFKPTLLQSAFPGLFASYKADHCQAGPPKGVSICVFHGKPRPHEVTEGWVPLVWKIGGGTSAVLESVCNTEANRLLENVRHVCRLDLPWLDKQPERSDEVVIAGGGPSLVESLDRIPSGAPILALNAAANWIIDRLSNARVAQIILDARPEMKEMVEPRALRHFFASQCHPSLFEIEGTNVTVFHPNIAGISEALGQIDKPAHLIGGGSTVGLQAMVIAYVLGYRKIHLIGMDSSYRDDKGHTYQQSLNDGERIVDVTVAGKNFKAAPWMIQQAEEFQTVAAQLANMGCEIVVHGDGLLPTVAREIARMHLLAEQGIIDRDGSPPCQRASAVLERLVGIEKPRGAEIGVFQAEMSRRLLAYRPDLSLIMVDSWATHSKDGNYAQSGDYHAGLTQEQQDFSYANAIGNVGFAKERTTILRESSVQAAQSVEDGSLDFVFIDAEHSYEGCLADINAWVPKLKPGGLLSGHDYSNADFPCFGVNRAVDEFAWLANLSIETGKNFTWFIRLPERLELSSAA